MNDAATDGFGEATFTDGDFQDPLNWIEKLSPSELLLWLRRVFWIKNALPITVPSTASLASHLVDLLSNGSANLLINLRSLIPELLREWGRNDPSECLEDMLVVCSATRSISAESTIVLIANERLKGRKDEIPLRQRCLMTLSGFGCTERTALIFKRYILDSHYVAICYRALYRFDLSYAATELQTVIGVYKQSNDLGKLKPILQLLFFQTVEPNQRAEIWKIFLSSIEATDLIDLLQTLKSIGIILIPHYQGNDESNENESEEIIVQYENFKTGDTHPKDVIKSRDFDYQIASAIINYSLEVATSDEEWVTETLNKKAADVTA